MRLAHPIAPAFLIALVLLAVAGVRPAFATDSQAAASSSTAADDPIAEAVAQTKKSLELQLKLPHQATKDDEGEDWHFKLPPGVVWIAAIGFGVILAFILKDMLPGWRNGSDEGWGMAGIGGLAAGQSAGANLATADALAEQGRFVEAMHVLLLHCLDEMKRRLKVDIADSLTSREIVRRAQLPEQAAVALKGIVIRVESSYFGDHPATRPDYESCRGRYEELVSLLALPAQSATAQPAVLEVAA